MADICFAESGDKDGVKLSFGGNGSRERRTDVARYGRSEGMAIEAHITGLLAKWYVS